jgi:cysteinyl-tRNA synthetase
MKDFLNKMTEKASEMKDAMMDNINLDSITEKISSIGDAAKEKITSTTNELISLSPIIEEMGYKTTGISITVGIPPDITFHFQKTSDVTAERRAAIMEQHKDKAMLGTIVKMLVTTDEYRDKLKLGSFKFNNIDVCIGLTPGMTIQLIPGGL